MPREAAPNGTIREFDLTAAPAELPLIDGSKKHLWAYNGSVPGPTLRVRLGDTVRVRFKNDLPQATTVHWHGVRVPNAMDGVPGATQPPVEPGGTFLYEFTPKDAGTFWFHPHLRSSEQVERGLYGLLIVEDAVSAPYDRDIAWVIDDFLLDEQGQIAEPFNTPHDLMHDGRWGNVITVNGSTKTALSLMGGQRVRLRLLNASNGRVYKPDFGSLNASVIAVDGTYLREPVPLSSLSFELAPGNRLDLDVSAPVQSGTSTQQIAVLDRFLSARPNHLADIYIEGATTSPIAFASPARAHVPHWSGFQAIPVTHEFRLNARRGGPLGIEWTIDDKAFAGHDHAAMLSLTQGKFHRLRFVNDSYRLHPIHVHGMFFRLLSRDGAPVDEPFFRDTVLIHGKETIELGVVPLDQGHWMMHCHILEHAEAGMMTMIDVVADRR